VSATLGLAEKSRLRPTSRLSAWWVIVDALAYATNERNETRERQSGATIELSKQAAGLE